MASDLFPIRRGRAQPAANPSNSEGLLQGNPLSDALLRAFRQTFGLASNDAAVQQALDAAQPSDGTIVPSSGETNP